MRGRGVFEVGGDFKAFDGLLGVLEGGVPNSGGGTGGRRGAIGEVGRGTGAVGFIEVNTAARVRNPGSGNLGTDGAVVWGGRTERLGGL